MNQPFIPDDHPRLGCATTKELLDELVSRLESDHLFEGSTAESDLQARLVARVLKKFQDGEFSLNERQLNYRTVDN